PAPEKTAAGPVTSSGWTPGKATITTRRGCRLAITRRMMARGRSVRNDRYRTIPAMAARRGATGLVGGGEGLAVGGPEGVEQALEPLLDVRVAGRLRLDAADARPQAVLWHLLLDLSRQGDRGAPARRLELGGARW